MKKYPIIRQVLIQITICICLLIPVKNVMAFSSGIKKDSVNDANANKQSSQRKEPDLLKYVNTLQGTNSRFQYSNGNIYPAVALPNGMNFWSPQTGKNGNGWKYQYEARTIRDLVKLISAARGPTILGFLRSCRRIISSWMKINGPPHLAITMKRQSRIITK